MATLLSLRLLSVLLIGALGEPAPGRIPKVYNALITSNQNLESSKAYPVYQPVLHDAFAYSFQPAFFYGGDLVGNGLLPQPALVPKEPQAPEAAPSSTPEPVNEVSQSATETAATTPEPIKPEADSNNPTPAPPSPPNTQSPIPLNEFGLPPQVLPISHIDPLYNALPQFSPFSYTYPGFRFYNPYDSFGFSPYTSLHSIYRPLPHVLGPNFPVVDNKISVGVNAPTPSEASAQTPPPEPSDLNILNYSSKDPAIPNVPPPPLPQGGLKTDKSE